MRDTNTHNPERSNSLRLLTGSRSRVFRRRTMLLAKQMPQHMVTMLKAPAGTP